MKEYKPEYLGKVLPDKPPKIKEFMQNKYDSFSGIYDACKSESNNISDIKNVTDESDNSSSLCVKVSAASDTIGKIGKKCSECHDGTLTVDNDTITCKKIN